MKLPVLSQGDLSDLRFSGLDDHAPLWFYVLREAETAENSERLGPAGARAKMSGRQGKDFNSPDIAGRAA